MSDIPIIASTAGNVNLDGITIDINEIFTNTVTLILDYDTSYYSQVVRVATNGSDNASQLIELDTDQDKVVVLYDIRSIAFLGKMSELVETYVEELYTIRVNSDTEFNGTLGSMDKSIIGWLELEGDVTFTITITGGGVVGPVID